MKYYKAFRMIMSCSDWSVRLLLDLQMQTAASCVGGAGGVGGLGGRAGGRDPDCTCSVVCWGWRVGWPPPSAARSETEESALWDTHQRWIRLNWTTQPLHCCVGSGLQWWDRITDTSVVFVRDYLLRPLKERQPLLFIWSCSPSSFSCGPPSSSSSLSRRSWKLLLVSQQSIPK